MRSLESRGRLLARQESEADRILVSCLNEHEVIAVRGTSCARPRLPSESSPHGLDCEVA